MFVVISVVSILGVGFLPFWLWYWFLIEASACRLNQSSVGVRSHSIVEPFVCVVGGGILW